MGIAFAACSPSVKVVEPVDGPSLELSAIDSLMWRQPDSALAQLQRFVASPAADSLDVFNGHYCQLLISELLYKNYKQQSNRDDLLLAVDYFDSIVAADGTDIRKPDAHGMSIQELNVFFDARAHYINGVGAYEKGDVVQACAEYLKALKLMEGCFEEKALVGKRAQFMANAYNRIGDLFSEQYMMESAITCYENALVYCKIEPTSPIGISNILYRIGKQYDKKNEIEKASLYYGQAIESMATTDNMVYRNIVASKALCDYEMKGDVKQSLYELNHVLCQAKTENERLNRYLTIGGIYFYEDNYDSALYYLEPVFENHEAGLQDQAANYLYIVYDKLGNKERSDSLVHHLTSRKESVGDNKALVSRLEDLYKNHSNQKLKRQAEAEREESVKRVKRIIIPSAGMVLFVVVFVLILRNKKLLKKQQDKADRELKDRDKRHAEAIEAERQAHRMEQAAISGRLKRKNQEIRELKDQIKQMDDSVTKSETVASFYEEPICRLIMERVNEGQFKSKIDYINYKDSALDKQQLLDLRLAVDRHFGQFTLRLRKTYPRLTNSDLDYCCLYLLGLNDADIAALMQRAYNTVVERDGKLRKIFGNNKPLPLTLASIANEELFI